MAGLAAPAAAQQAQYLMVDKTVDATEVLLPGNPFSYTIRVNCAEADCIDAELTDALPTELHGFPLTNVNTSPGAGSLPREITWTEAGEQIDQPGVVGSATALRVNFQQDLADGGQGLIAGEDFTITLTLEVPAGQPSLEPTEVVNTAETTADNSFDDASSATISVRTPANFDVAASKSWAPAEQSFNPGEGSTISLGVTSADSNVPVDSLVLQEPASAADGASELDPSNPFTITDFTGFGSSTLPDGATAVQVDAYVRTGDTWAWVTGDPSGTVALPAGVEAGDVGGLRLTYTGEIEPDSSGTIDLELEQRAMHRNTDEDLSTESHAVANVVAATATLAGYENATDEASASYTVSPANVAAETSKNIQPNRIGAGGSASATLTATNASDVGVAEMRISDLDFFTEQITFAGFDSGISWPETASEAFVIYYPLDGSDAQQVSFNDGETPAAPISDISGLEIVFTSDDGEIAPHSTANVAFTIETAEDATGDAAEISATNTVTTQVAAPNGLQATATDSDILEIIRPGVDVSLDKTVRPSTAVAPGERVITSLATTANALSDNSTLTQIVVEDAWTGGTDGFWNAFDLSEIAPTQVPAHASLTLQVRDGDNWVTIAAQDARDEAWIYSLTSAELGSALDDASVSPDAVQGIRFTFDNDTGFPANTTITPHVVSQARAEQRANGEPTTAIPEDEPAYAEYPNTAITVAAGRTDSGTPLEDRDEDTDQGQIVTYPGEPGPLKIDKRWTRPSVVAQSSQQASTVLDWRVSADAGLERVTIADPVAPEPVADSVFDTFDLVALAAIPASSEPFSNGWYLRYDTVVGIELYDGEDWVAVDVPGDGWVQNGSFVGYELSEEEQQEAIGVRLVLEENTSARQTALEDGTDPFAPHPGSGVAAGPDRAFILDWRVRDRTRADNAWVTQSGTYNHADAGVVDNSVELVGEDAQGRTWRSTDNATIRILNADPAVNLDKSVTLPDEGADDRLFTPPTGTDPEDYPEVTYHLVANNASTSRASYVRITDPATCGDTDLTDCQTEGTVDGATSDPFDPEVDWLNAPGGLSNVFDRFTLTGVEISADLAGEVDLSESTVWLLRYDGQTYTSQRSNAAQVNDLAAEDLADVVGLSVTFQGSDPENSGGTITQRNRLRVDLTAQLRSQQRSTGEAQFLPATRTIDLDNRAFAQSYDPILADGQSTGDTDNAQVVLTGGEINVAPTKSITPDAIIEAAPDVPVTVALGANQGISPRSTLSPNRVVIEDQALSGDFWNTFSLTGLGELELPDGADRVQVDVYGPFGDDGELDWVAGAPSASAHLPDVDFAEVQGVRVTFDREDGALFSTTVPAPNWSGSLEFTYELRETYRDSGDPVLFAGTVTNTQTSQSLRDDGSESDVVDTTATIDLGPGTQELSVQKLANNGSRTGNRGQSYPWDLTFENSGTGFLTVTELRDALPEHLIYTGEQDPVYTAEPDGLLSDEVTLEVEDQELIFTWPEDGDRMAPGETFNIRIHLELGIGAPAGQNVTNTMTVRTEEELTSCSHIGNGDTTGAWGDDPTTCGTTDYMTPSNIASIFSAKGVMGSLDGAYNPNNPDATCAPTLNQDEDSYYRYPCVAHSQIGGVDDWLLRAANSGGTGVAELTLFEQLPVESDQLLLTGNPRGSQYRPQIVQESLQAHAPEGTEITVEVTTSSGVCVGTYTNLENQEVCEQNGEVWEPIGVDTDWAAISGIRVHFDFTTTTAGELQTGGIADVTFSTRNVPATEADSSGAPVEVGVEDALAWNQAGLKFRYSGSQAFGKRIPAQVGVHLLFGSVQIDKQVTGPAAEYAPDEFVVDLAGSIGDVPLDFGAQSQVTLSEANGYTVRIDGIPYATDPATVVTFSEHGQTGEFGESSRSLDPADGRLRITEPADPAGAEAAVSPGQTGTVINDYQFTGLSITKEVDTEATEGDFGPFDFTLQCTTSTGAEVVFDDDGSTLQEFTLENGGTFTAPENRIPVGADCVLTETDSSFADQIVVVGDNVEDHRDGTATITPGTEPAEVTVTNGYDAGVFEVAKIVDGEGAELYGQGPFGFDAVCTYQGQTLLQESFELEGGSTRSFGVFPAGTECEVIETADGGATRTWINPEGGIFEIPNPVDPDETSIAVVEIEATNTFDFGQLQIDKVIEGEGADLYGAGPFQAQVMCTWERDGEVLDIELANDGVVALSEDNGYTATIENLIVGADCEVTETLTGGATSSSISPANGAVTVPANENGEQQAVTVTLTNSFDVGRLEIVKDVVGDGAQLYGAGPFEAQVMCTWERDGEVLDIELADDGVVVLSEDNGYTVMIEDLVVGADCEVTETLTGGATSSAVSPEGGLVTIPANDEPGEQQTVTVTLTNVFDVTSLDVTKEVQGNVEAPGATGPFTVALTCTWEVDGVVTEVEIPGGSERELSEGNNLKATYDHLPVGAHCEITETETQGADGTLITVVVAGHELQTTEGTTADVDLTSTTEPGQARAIIVNSFDEEPVAPVVPEGEAGANDRVGGLSATGVAVGAAIALALLLLLGGTMLVRRSRVEG